MEPGDLANSTCPFYLSAVVCLSHLSKKKTECVALVEEHLMSPPEFETRSILRNSKAKKIQQLEETKPFPSRLRELRTEISFTETRVTTAGELLLLLKSNHTLRLPCSG